MRPTTIILWSGVSASRLVNPTEDTLPMMMTEDRRTDSGKPMFLTPGTKLGVQAEERKATDRMAINSTMRTGADSRDSVTSPDVGTRSRFFIVLTHYDRQVVPPQSSNAERRGAGLPSNNPPMGRTPNLRTDEPDDALDSTWGSLRKHQSSKFGLT